ncbi:MAG: GIN domain-containing protein, partial [Bacteroidia bacterium]
MKKSIVILMSVLSISLFAQTDKGQKKTIERNLSSFNAIEAGESFSLEVKNGNTSTLLIEVTEGYEGYVKSDVEGAVLKISSDKRMKQPKHLKLTITSPEITSVELFGAAEMKSIDTLRAENLEVKLSGAANANLILTVQNLKTEI